MHIITGQGMRPLYCFEACYPRLDKLGFGSSVTTNPLPAHTLHTVPPSAGDIHFMDFIELDDRIHMLSWDDSEP